jgi:hypothetical protein
VLVLVRGGRSPEDEDEDEHAHDDEEDAIGAIGDAIGDALIRNRRNRGAIGDALIRSPCRGLNRRNRGRVDSFTLPARARAEPPCVSRPDEWGKQINASPIDSSGVNKSGSPAG